MASSGSSDALKKTIAWLETEQSSKQELLKEEFDHTLESLKPINLVKDAMSEITSNPASIENLLIPLLGLGAGFLAKRLVVGKSENPQRQAIGDAVQASITSAVAQNPAEIKRMGIFVIQFFRGRKKVESEQDGR